MQHRFPLRPLISLAILVLCSDCRPRRRDASELESVAPSECHMTMRCSNQIAKDWSLHAVDVDLMRESVAAMGVSQDVFASAAVVDSGFDKRSESRFRVNGPVRVERGAVPEDVHPINNFSKFEKDEVGDPAIDENGHGTAVSSTIAGRDTGNSDGVKLTVYRVIRPGNSGSSKDSVLAMAAYKACTQNKDPDAIVLINMSLGGRLDESQIKIDEKEDQALIAKFAENGCLIFKAAGNDNFRRTRADVLDDAYLRVGSVDASNELSWFSTVGEISAPGSDIFTIISQSKVVDPDSKREPRLCDAKSGYQFVNGTSFSTPFALGIGAQVVRVLKHFGGLSKLTNPERIRLVNRILAASQIAGPINGLRAVTIAKRWSEATSQQKSVIDQAGVDGLTKLLVENSDPVCGQPPPVCDRIRECSATKSCLNQVRRSVALCPQLEAASEVASAAASAFRIGEFELGHRLSQRSFSLKDDEATRTKLLRLALSQYLASVGFELNSSYKVRDQEEAQKKQRDGIRKMSSNFFRIVISPYLALRAKQKGTLGNSGFLDYLMDGIMNSSSIQGSLSLGVDPKTGEHRGGGPVAESVADALLNIKSMMGETRFIKLLGDLVVGQARETRESRKNLGRFSMFDFGNSSSSARMLDLLINRVNPGTPIYTKLASIETNLLTEIRGMNEYYGEATDSLPIFSEIYPTRSVMDGMMLRNRNQLVSAVESGQYSNLAPVQVHYLQRHLAELFPNKIVPITLDILKTLASGQGWTPRNDKEIFENALITFNSIWSAQSPAAQEEIVSQFKSLVQESVSVDFLAMISYGYWQDRVFGMSLTDMVVDQKRYDAEKLAARTYRRSPLLSAEVIASIGTKITAWLSSMKGRHSLADLQGRIQIQYGVAQAWMGMLLNARPDATPVKIPVAANPPFDRLNAPRYQIQTYLPKGNELDLFMRRIQVLSTFSGATDQPPTTLDGEDAFERSRDANAVISTLLEWTFYVRTSVDPTTISANEIYKRLPVNGAWRSDVKWIADHGAYPANFKAQEFLQAVDVARR